MRLLLDTQLAIWWHFEDHRLSSTAREVTEAADEGVYFSHVSLWEMAVKIAAGKSSIDLPEFAMEIDRLGFLPLRLRESHIFESARLAWSAGHKDPFDRLLVAQAKTEGLTLLTADRTLQRYGDFVRVV